MYASSFFTPIPIIGYNKKIEDLTPSECSSEVCEHKEKILHGKAVLWGIPFELGPDGGNNLVHLKDGTINLAFEPVAANHIIFVHASDLPAPEADQNDMYPSFRGDPPLGERICEYIIHYADGSESVIPIKSRMEINNMALPWGQNPYAAVPHKRPSACQSVSEDLEARRIPRQLWGPSQYRNETADEETKLMHWLYAWENPHPDIPIKRMEIKCFDNSLFFMGMTASHLSESPLRYGRRQKVALTLEGDHTNPLALIDIDLGQIISVLPRPVYNHLQWESGYNNQQPDVPEKEYIVEFCAHKDAHLYLGEDKIPLAVRDLANGKCSIIPSVEQSATLRNLAETKCLVIPPAEQPVTLRVLGPDGQPTAVKVHAHGTGGEYLPPRNRHRVPNPYFFEDYSVDFLHGPHWCTYIDGTAEYLLPQGEVFFEVSKGFEIAPVRCRFEISPATKEIEIKLEQVLDWRSQGWVTSDTHVHFLSPHSALLEGEAEGINLVHLLASQWGELFTNVGDFDGRSVVAKNEDYQVRVGTENRQQMLGHISLVGYEGPMILPLTTGGPSESALGDPIETTLTEWARQCRAQAGVNILPHFPDPRGEFPATIVSEMIDGVEMTSWGALYAGISPYSLSDWYRFLNCGYHVAVVGGTDKMSANTAVGTVRTYAKIEEPFSLESWRDAVKKGRTFVTYGALVDLCVEGKFPGEQIALDGSATLHMEWSVASATIPITSVELVMGGDTIDSKRFDGLLGSSRGSFKVNVEAGSWIALRVRGHQADKPEIVIAHTSAVMITVAGKKPMNLPDAITILEQIEGVTAYVKTLGTRAQEQQYKQIIMTLTSAHRALHNRLHAQGVYHKHSVLDEHHHN